MIEPYDQNNMQENNEIATEIYKFSHEEFKVAILSKFELQKSREEVY